MMKEIAGRRIGTSSGSKGWLESKYIEYMTALSRAPKTPPETTEPTPELTREQKLAIGSNIIRTLRNKPDFCPDEQDHNMSKADTQDGVLTDTEWAQH